MKVRLLSEKLPNLASNERRVAEDRRDCYWLYKVILEADLARLYGLGAKRLNEAVRRNIGRFPADFMFQLTREQFGALRSQFVALNSKS